MDKWDDGLEERAKQLRQRALEMRDEDRGVVAFTTYDINVLLRLWDRDRVDRIGETSHD